MMELSLDGIRKESVKYAASLRIQCTKCGSVLDAKKSCRVATAKTPQGNACAWVDCGCIPDAAILDLSERLPVDVTLELETWDGTRSCNAGQWL